MTKQLLPRASHETHLLSFNPKEVDTIVPHLTDKQVKVQRS